MVCTFCWSETQVLNSRPQKRTNGVWRRRCCKVCGRVFTTREHVDYEKSWVVQSTSHSNLPFVQDKLLLSIHASLGHRQTALPDALALTRTIIGKLGKMVDQQGCISSDMIVTTAHKTLLRFDTVAATVYQAYHA